MLSCVLILPVDLVPVGDAVGAAMGWGPKNYTVNLRSSSGLTHMGLHAWVTEGFRDLVVSGAYPPALADAGITEPAHQAMTAALISSFQALADGHFDQVCAAHGLTRVEE